MTDPKETILTLTSPEDGIAVLTLNQPDSRNALSIGMLGALLNAISDISKQKHIKTVILAANGPTFCAGHDLKEMAAHREDEDGGKKYFGELFTACANVMLAINQSSKIFIAKVHAPATAAGCQLVATCDMAIASEDVQFGVNGINSGLFCSTPMVALSRNIGAKAAMAMLTTGDMMSATEARIAGLINRVTEPEGLDVVTLQMARSVAEKPANVLALGKRAFYQQLSMPMPQAYEHATNVILKNIMLPEADEGIAAFLNKRKPEWIN